ncbi:MAG: sulfatase-like hydrolase/transferase, partial [Acidobacteriota bacterium]|nr:sulfatase-like hydrolase/transferase [Acidobacteriota bacterium]
MSSYLQRLGIASVAAGLLAMSLGGASGAAERPTKRPNVLLISVDTLRTDRMSGYGHDRPTTPVIDALLERGARFEHARTPAPLTAPAMASVMTSLYPHDHGSTRNGLRVRPRLVSFSNVMQRRGYRTAAVVGNWTLRPKLSGLDEHFESYSAVLNRKRWFGLAKRESTAEDLNVEALEWLDAHLENDAGRPFLLWVHYVEPHAPYQLRSEYSRKLGIKKGAGVFSPRNRY